MKKTMMGWAVVVTLALTAVLAVPSDVRSQFSAGALRAAELESEALSLHNQPDRWAYASALYMAAAQLRAVDDPQAQVDLLLAANLVYETGNAETGNAAGPFAALESAGDRALVSGDIVRAADMFADAAWVAQKADLRSEQRRLTVKSIELAESSEITRAERRRILWRFRGR